MNTALPGATSAPTPVSSPLTRRLMGLALLATVGAGLIALFTGVWMAFSDVPGFGGEEANVVFSVQQLVAGQPIYTDPSEPPFTITQYSPLFYVVSANLARLVGVEATDPAGITRVCRLVSLVAAVGVSLVVFGIAIRLRLAVAVSVLIAAFCFVSAVPWHFLARPDALLCFFLVLAVYLVLGVTPDRPLRSHLHTAGAVLAAFLALASKQNGLQALGLVLLYLVFARAWWEMATAFLCSAALVGLTVAMLGPITGYLGPALRENLVDGVRNGTDLIAALDRTFAPYVRQYALLVALATIAGVFLWRTGGARQRFLAISLPLLMLFACGTGLKAGSAMNYFIEFTIFAALATGLYCQSVAQSNVTSAEVSPASGAVIPVLVVVSALLFVPVLAVDEFKRLCYSKSVPRSLTPNPQLQFGANDRILQALRQELRANPGTRVLPIHSPIISTLAFPHTVMPHPRIALSSDALGLVDYRKFRAFLENGKVGLLVSKAGEPPTSFLGVRFENARLLHEADGYAIYEFVPTSPVAARRE